MFKITNFIKLSEIDILAIKHACGFLPEIFKKQNNQLNLKKSIQQSITRPRLNISKITEEEWMDHMSCKLARKN